RTHLAEAHVCRPEKLACIRTAIRAPQPLSVQQLAAGELDCGAATRQPLDRLVVAGLVIGHQRTAACLHAEPPVRGARLGPLAEPIQSVGSLLRLSVAGGGLD